MESLLAELRILEAKIKAYGEKPKRIFSSRICAQKDKDIFRDSIEYSDLYFLITLTFDPKVSINLDEYGQFKRLQDVINQCSNYNYYSCIEKHKSGILHAHIMIKNESVHELEELMYKNRKYITKSIQLNPAIQIKTVKRTKDDIDRTYNYIWDDKKDHPIYKYIKINI